MFGTGLAPVAEKTKSRGPGRRETTTSLASSADSNA